MHDCQDIVGPGDNAPLTITHILMDGGLINRPNTGFFSPWFSNYVADVYDNSANFGHLGLSDVPSNVEAATQAAARTNPSRPYVDVPANLLELGDVAHILRSTGTGLLRRIAGENLRYQFAIRPLVSDLTRLMVFQRQLDNRLAELQRLQTQKGLRRTVQIGTYSAQDSINYAIQSQGIFASGAFDVNTVQTVRAHTRWTPNGDFSLLRTDQDKRRLVTRALLGLTVDFSTLWEPMPWSWLIDWCSNVGDFFKANRNIIPAQLADVSVIRHTRSEYRNQGWTDGTAVIAPGNVIRETKGRATSFVAPVAHFHILSGNQMGLLASLAVTRS